MDLHLHFQNYIAEADPEGVQGVRLNLPPRSPFEIFYENVIISSQIDQIISFPWDI